MINETLFADAFKLFNEMFKEGDEVIVITDEDEFQWGKLGFEGDEKVTLSRPGHRLRTLDWDEVRFISHDGFPVKRMRGAEGSWKILHEKNASGDIREMFFDWQFCDSCGKRPVRNNYLHGQKAWDAKTCRSKDCSFKFGDPFAVEDVDLGLVNPGRPFIDGQYEETLILRDPRGGASALLWDLTTVFHWSAKSSRVVA